MPDVHECIDEFATADQAGGSRERDMDRAKRKGWLAA
jgi:hypothetical protein